MAHPTNSHPTNSHPANSHPNPDPESNCVAILGIASDIDTVIHRHQAQEIAEKERVEAEKEVLKGQLLEVQLGLGSGLGLGP